MVVADEVRSADEVLYEVDGHEADGRVATITLNRPQQRNAVDPALAAAMSDVMAAFEGDPEVWVAVLTGAGATFSAGADLKAIASGRACKLVREPGRFTGFGAGRSTGSSTGSTSTSSTAPIRRRCAAWCRSR